MKKKSDNLFAYQLSAWPINLQMERKKNCAANNQMETFDFQQTRPSVVRSRAYVHLKNGSETIELWIEVWQVFLCTSPVVNRATKVRCGLLIYLILLSFSFANKPFVIK